MVAYYGGNNPANGTITARGEWPCRYEPAKLIASEPREKPVKGDHIHLRSPDPEATAAWLEKVLGGVIIRGPGRIDVKLGGANVFTG